LYAVSSPERPMLDIRPHLVAVVAILASVASGTALADESPSVPQRAGHAVQKAGDATGRGLKRGVEATTHGVQVGVNATGRGLSRAGQAVEHGTHKAAEKVRATFEK
jgi:hypothetical protein